MDSKRGERKAQVHNTPLPLANNEEKTAVSSTDYTSQTIHDHSMQHFYLLMQKKMPWYNEELINTKLAGMNDLTGLDKVLDRIQFYSELQLVAHFMQRLLLEYTHGSAKRKYLELGALAEILPNFKNKNPKPLEKFDVIQGIVQPKIAPAEGLELIFVLKPNLQDRFAKRTIEKYLSVTKFLAAFDIALKTQESLQEFTENAYAGAVTIYALFDEAIKLFQNMPNVKTRLGQLLISSNGVIAASVTEMKNTTKTKKTRRVAEAKAEKPDVVAPPPEFKPTSSRSRRQKDKPLPRAPNNNVKPIDTHETKVAQLNKILHENQQAVNELNEEIKALKRNFRELYHHDYMSLAIHADNKASADILSEMIIEAIVKPMDSLNDKFNTQQQSLKPDEIDLNLINTKAMKSDLASLMKLVKNNFAEIKKIQLALDNPAKAKKITKAIENRNKMTFTPEALQPPGYTSRIVSEQKSSEGSSSSLIIFYKAMRINYLNRACHNLVFLHHALDRYENSDNQETLRYAMLYNILECFQAMVTYQIGSKNSDTQKLSGISIAENALVLARSFKYNLPQAILNKSLSKLITTDFEDAERQEIIVGFALAKMSSHQQEQRELLDQSKLLIDESAVYAQLDNFHQKNCNPASQLPDDESLLIKYISLIKKILPTISPKIHDDRVIDQQFLVTHLFEIQALYMLTRLCGELNLKLDQYHDGLTTFLKDCRAAIKASNKNYALNSKNALEFLWMLEARMYFVDEEKITAKSDIITPNSSSLEDVKDKTYRHGI